MANLELMDPLRTERELWQFTVAFGGTEDVAPNDLMALLGKVAEIFPVPSYEVSWQMPALNSGTFQIQIGMDGAATVAPDFLVGTSPRGWTMQLSSRQLVLRHQQGARNDPEGRQVRTTAFSDFPTVETFCEVALRAVGALPSAFLAGTRRLSASANYVIPCFNVYPGGVIASRLFGQPSPARYAPEDNTRYIVGLHEASFETFSNLRYVWNNTSRMVRWFGPGGHLLQNAGVSKALELRTASPETEEPLIALPSLEALPVIPIERTTEFVSAGVEGALPRILARLRRELEPGVTFNV